MAKQVDLPLIGAEVDPDDPSGTAQSVVLGIVGLIFTFGIIAMAQNLYNDWVAEPTPDTFSEIELV